MAIAKFVCLALLALVSLKTTLGIGQKLTYLEAKAYCSTRGGLPMPRSNTEEYELQRKLHRLGITTVWIRGEKHILNKWTWINGTENVLGILKPKRNHNCAGFDQKSKSIFTAACGEEVRGHVCEAKRCEDCYKDFGWKGQVCRKFGDKCFLFHCDNKNWFNSRSACGNESQDLAIIQNNDMMTWLSGLPFFCTQFWIGLRREIWRGQGEPLFSNWGENQPATGECRVLSSRDGRITWVSTDCNNRENTICSVGEGITIYRFYTTPAARKAKDGKSSNLAAIIVPVLICILLFGIGIFAFVFWKRKNPSCLQRMSSGEKTIIAEAREKCLNEERMCNEEEEKNNEDNSPLIGVSTQQLQEHLREESDTLSRVKTSKGNEMILLEMDKIYTDVEIFHEKQQLTFDQAFFQIKQTKVKRLLISGNNGVGKTTLARKMLRKWLDSLQTNYSEESFRYVIFIPLSKIVGDWNFHDILGNIFKLDETIASAIYKDAIDNPHGTLIILDGYNEFKHMSSKCSDILQIVEGKLLPKVKVLVTCRFPTRRYLCEGWSRFAETYEVSGFRETEVETYVEKHPSRVSDNIKQMLKKEPLSSLVRYPHLLRFLCDVLKESIDNSEVYDKYLEYSFNRYNQKFGSNKEIVFTSFGSGQQKDDHVLKELDDEKFKEHVIEIGKMVLDYILRSKKKAFSFSLRALKDISETSLQLGFLVFIDESTIRFPVEEFREYFAAHFLAFTDSTIRLEYLGKMNMKASAEDSFNKIMQFMGRLVAEDEDRMNHLNKDLSKFSQFQETFSKFCT